MERLTLVGYSGVCQMASTEYCHKHRDCYECGHGRKVFKRLAAYEDTELEPEEINAIVGLASENCAKTADKIDQILAEDTELSAYRSIGTVEEFRTMKAADQKRREGCDWCRPDSEGYTKMLGGFSIQGGKLYAKGFKPRKINQCYMCGRDLRGENHDGD